MGEHTRRRDLEATYARLQAARHAGDTTRADQLARELRELAPATQDPADRRDPARARRLRRRRLVGTVLLTVTLAATFGLGAFAASAFVVGLADSAVVFGVSGAVIGALLGLVIRSTVGLPEGPGPLARFYVGHAPGEG